MVPGGILNASATALMLSALSIKRLRSGLQGHITGATRVSNPEVDSTVVTSIVSQGEAEAEVPLDLLMLMHNLVEKCTTLTQFPKPLFFPHLHTQVIWPPRLTAGLQ